MKNIVIAASHATRFYPLAKNLPNPLLKIGSYTILERLIDDIDRIENINDYINVTNHNSPDILRNGPHSNRLNEQPEVLVSNLAIPLFYLYKYSAFH